MNAIKTKEIPYSDPLYLFNTLHQQKWSLLLDSAMQHTKYGRYSYIAFDPFQVMTAKNGRIMVDDELNACVENPFGLLKAYLMQMSQMHLAELPPFQGGIAGIFSYDLYQYIDNIQSNQEDEQHIPDMAVGFYDVVISFDHIQQKAWIVSTGWPEQQDGKRLIRAQARLNEVGNWFQSVLQVEKDAQIESKPQKRQAVTQQLIESNFNAMSYAVAVEQVIEYIRAGDIFEANISQRFKAKLPFDVSPYHLYQTLRANNPAPFAAFMNLGDICIVSASPERFLKLTEHHVETRPIKGTRPRSADKQQDELFVAELLSSEKDHAENVTIVDLLRNDLSKVCQDHSIQVTQLCALESYATVHHLVSVVEGQLKPNYDAVDLMQATFPGGSITGAPKIRAMEIIAEIEPTKRGLYCGCIGFMGFNGTMDMSIAIRTYTIKENIVTFQAGGAVVIDSLPDEEYCESLAKSKALHDALERFL
jgi:para-aminobenzoate synthetase component 1